MATTLDRILQSQGFGTRRYCGDLVAAGLVEVNGELCNLTTKRSLLTTDNLITSTGADAGAVMAANTLYYAYASNSHYKAICKEIPPSVIVCTLCVPKPQCHFRRNNNV